MNRLLVAPSVEELSAAITDAVGSLKAKSRRPDAPVMSAEEIATAAAQATGGLAAGRVYRSRRDKIVAIDWWSDVAGRRHVRVRARVDGEYDAPREGDDPFAAVYPGVLQACGPHRIVACGCGAVGAPEAVGWMGERCGPCQDRAEEGGPVTPPQVFPGGNGHSTVAFTPDGRGLVYPHATADRAVRRDLRTGAATELTVHDRRTLAAVGFDPAGRTLLLFADARMTAWDQAAGAGTTCSLRDARDWVRISPNGRFQIHGDPTGLLASEWIDPTALMERTPFDRAFGGGFDRVGDTWVYLTGDDQFVRVHLPTRTRSVLARNVFAAAGLRTDVRNDPLVDRTPWLAAVCPERDLACACLADPLDLSEPLALGSLTLARPWRSLAFDGGALRRVAFSP